MKNVTITIIVIVVAVAILVYFYQSYKPFDDNTDFIVVVSPLKDAEISSPLTVSGRARGTWFFEGSFPIVILDAYRNVIAESHATAQGEWMTEDFVNFVGTLQFNNYIKGQKGILVLKKDNPSGLVEYDESIEIPVIFK